MSGVRDRPGRKTSAKRPGKVVVTSAVPKAESLVDVTDSTEHPDLDAGVIDAIASRLLDVLSERVLEALREDGMIARASTRTQWLDAAEVSRRLGVTREWVYGHASELGAVRIGQGPRPRLRFPPTVLESNPRADRRGRERDRAPRRSTHQLMAVYDG